MQLDDWCNILTWTGEGKYVGNDDQQLDKGE